MTHLYKRLMKMIIFPLLLIGLLLQSGCAFKDIDKRLFIAAIGVDPAETMEEGYKVTLKVNLPFGAIKQSSKPLYAYLSAEAETVGDAMRILETHADKVLELGHVKAIVIHEDLLHDHVKKFMDYFIRRGDIQMISYVAAGKPSAEEVLKVEPDTEAPASTSLFNLFGDTGTESPFIVTTYLFQFRRDFFGIGIDPVIPLIKASIDGNELIVNTSLVVSEKQKTLELDKIQTKYYNSIVNKSSGFSYKVESDDLRLLLNIDRVKMKYHINTDGRTPTSIDMKLKLVGIVGESNQSLSFRKLDKYDKVASKVIEEKVIDLLLTLQKEGLDPFGFELRYRATHLHSDEIDSIWKEASPQLTFNVSVDVELKSTGTTE